MLKFVCFLVMGTLLLLACGSDGDLGGPTEPLDLFPTLDPLLGSQNGSGIQATSQFRPATRTLTPVPTNTPVVRNLDDARNLVWVHLGRCISLDIEQLDGNLVKGDWFVKASKSSPQQYGLWKVEPAAGILEPQDPLARRLEEYLESQCSREIFATLYTPAPTVTPTPSPTPVTLPTSTPVAENEEQARILAWVYLSQCFPFDPEQLEAYLAQGLWYVQPSSASRQQLGIWKVDVYTGGLEPHDMLVANLQTYVESECSSEVYATLFPLHLRQY